MSGSSAIGWTDATWNPVTGCSRVSDGCDHCYAEAYTGRMAGQPGWIEEHRPWTPENAEHNVRLHPTRLGMPGRWRRPRMVFVNSMSDLFHPRVPGQFINDVWMQMFNNPRHTFQILTKRPKRLRDWTYTAARAKGWPVEEIWPDWMWVGTSIESRDHVDRADMLREVPAAVRFISAEPLLGPLVPDLQLDDIAWLIVGGESGDGHRPIRPSWVRDLRDLAADSGTAFFFKQWGGRTPKSGGRVLDGRTWDEFPERVVEAYGRRARVVPLLRLAEEA